MLTLGWELNEMGLNAMLKFLTSENAFVSIERKWRDIAQHLRKF